MNCRETTFQITIMCDHGHRFIGNPDSQRSIPDRKRGNVTSTAQPFTFGLQFLVVQTQTLTDEGHSLMQGLSFNQDPLMQRHSFL